MLTPNSMTGTCRTPVGATPGGTARGKDVRVEPCTGKRPRNGNQFFVHHKKTSFSTLEK